MDFVSNHGTYPLSGNSDPQFPEHKSVWQQSLLSSDAQLIERLICPSAIVPKLPQGDAFAYFGYNDRGVIGSQEQEPLGLGGNGKWPRRAPPVAESEVRRPTDMIAIIDAAQAWNGLIEDGRTAYSGLYFYSEGSVGGNSRMLLRHGGVVQIAFCDGHVGKERVSIVFTDNSAKGLSLWNRDGLPHSERLIK